MSDSSSVSAPQSVPSSKKNHYQWTNSWQFIWENHAKSNTASLKRLHSSRMEDFLLAAMLYTQKGQISSGFYCFTITITFHCWFFRISHLIADLNFFLLELHPRVFKVTFIMIFAQRSAVYLLWSCSHFFWIVICTSCLLPKYFARCLSSFDVCLRIPADCQPAFL